jgi:hypothetical protein
MRKRLQPALMSDDRNLSEQSLMRGGAPKGMKIGTGTSMIPVPRILSKRCQSLFSGQIEKIKAKTIQGSKIKN